MNVRRLCAASVSASAFIFAVWTPSATADALADPGLRRVGGAERLDTAVLLSRDATPECPDAGCGTVVLARADLPIDALAGAPLASSLNAPILLTDPMALSAATAAEIRRLRADRVILLGGISALSDRVQQDLQALGVSHVERIEGPTRYHTAAEVARRLDPDHVLVAAGGFSGGIDALAAGPLAAASEAAVLLAEADHVPPATGQAMRDLGIGRVTIVGGTASISEETAELLAGPNRIVDRIGGSTRHETAVLVAESSAVRGTGPAVVYVADGETLPDAVAASASAARRGGVLLLVDGADLAASSVTTEYLERFRPLVHELVVVGGNAVVTPSSYSFVVELMRRQGRPYETFSVEAVAPSGEFHEGEVIPLTVRSCNGSPDPYSQQHPRPLQVLLVIDERGAVVADDRSEHPFTADIVRTSWAAGECKTRTVEWQQGTGSVYGGQGVPPGPRAAPGKYRLRVGWRGVEDGARFPYPPVYSGEFTLQ